MKYTYRDECIIQKGGYQSPCDLPIGHYYNAADSLEYHLFHKKETQKGFGKAA